MANTLLIRPNGQNYASCDYVLIDQNNTIISQNSSDDLGSLQELATNHPMVLVIPSVDVLITSTQIPTSNKAKLRKAIPYALEEQLTEDINQYHFAFVDMPEEQKQNVAAISKTTLAKYLEPWKDIDCKIQAIIPDVLLMSIEDQQWTLAIEHNLGILKMDENQGLGFDIDNIQIAMDSALEHSENPPKVIRILSRDDEISFSVKGKIVLDLAIQQQPLINQLCENYSAAKELSFHEFILGDEHQPRFQKLILIITFLVGLLISIWMLNQGLRYYKLNRAQQQASNEIESIYKQLYPQATSVVAPKVRIQRDLNKYTSGETKGEFLSLLYKSHQALKAVTGVKLDSLDYKRSKMTLSVASNDFKQLNELKAKLQQENLKVKQDNAKQGANHVSARFTLTL